MKKNILIIILLVITIGLTGYITYDKVIGVSTSPKTTKKESKETKENSNLTKGQVDYYLSVVPLSLEQKDAGKDAYAGTKTTIDDIADETKYGMAYNNTNETTEKPSINDAHSELKELMGSSPESEYYNGVVKAEEMEKTIKSMYNISLNNVDKFEYPGGMVFKSGNYYSVYYGRGSEAVTKFTIDSSYSYNKSDLIITEKAIFSFNDPENETTEMIYTNTSKTNKIGEESYENTQVGAYMKEHYMENATTFIHTFKQNKDGSYYWYSTEAK